MKEIQKDQRELLMFMAWAISVISMFGSLFFSEILHYEPCNLCWYERIIMYPFAVILGMATVRKDYKLSLYAMVLSLIGAMISLYHYLLQKISFIADAAPACGRVPCTDPYINWFGFISIPLLAFAAFIIIFICNLLIWKKSKECFVPSVKRKEWE